MIIPMKKCIERRIYKVDGRNIDLAVYIGDSAFIGIRTKFGYRFLATEFHEDSGPPFGTVKCRVDTGITLPYKIEPAESLGTIDSNTKASVYYKPTGDGYKWDFSQKGIYKEEEIKNIKPVRISNDALFNFLDDLKNKV